MNHSIKTGEDLRWFLTHTQGFRDGQVTDVHLSRRRIFDEESGHDLPAGSTVTVVLRYHLHGILRVAKLTMQGVSDLSIFEQDGADGSSLGVVQVELNEGKLRFWFDPQGEFYVVCEEALFEEVSLPYCDGDLEGTVTQWVFQADSGEVPTVAWLLDRLDHAGVPCIWREAGLEAGRHRGICWEGELTAASDLNAGLAATVVVRTYGPIDGAGFGMQVRLRPSAGRSGGRLLDLVTDLVTQCFPGTCLVGQGFLLQEERSNRRSPGRAQPARL